MLIGLGAALLAAVVFGVGAVLQAIAMRRAGFLSPLMLLVGVAYLGGWALHLVAIANVPLYLAQVGVATSLAVTGLVAAVVVGEPLARRHWVAIGALIGGLALLVVSSGAVGRARFDETDALALYAGLVLLTGAGWLVARGSGARNGVSLGYLAGLAYTGSPVASRSLVHFAWRPDIVAGALSIGLFGLLGFCLYSVAMRRTSVTAATAPLVLLETVGPAILGVVAFGDGVRAGWWPVALAGFFVSTLAALVLCDAEARLEHLSPEELPA